MSLWTNLMKNNHKIIKIINLKNVLKMFMEMNGLKIYFIKVNIYIFKPLTIIHYICKIKTTTCNIKIPIWMKNKIIKIVLLL